MSSDSPTAQFQRTGQILVFLGALIICLASFGCSKEASANKSGAKSKATMVSTPLPAQMLRVPQGYVALFYMESPAKFAEEWFSNVVSQKGVAPFADEISKLMSGPNGSGKDFLAGFDGPTVIAVYGDPRKNDKPVILLQVAGGKREMLEPWVEEWFGSANTKETSFSDSMVMRSGPLGPWVFGTASDSWILCNDERVAERAAQQGETVEASAPLLESWKNLASHDTVAFFMADLRRLTPGEERVSLERVGLDRVSTISIGVDEVAPGRYQESLFISSGAPHSGLLSFFDGKRLSKAIAGSVPNDAKGFSMLSLDLLSMWENVRDMLPPMQLAKVQSIEEALSVRFGEDLFAALGTYYACYSLENESGEPSMVYEVGLDDTAKFRDVLGKLLPHSPMEMSWETTPKGQMVLTGGTGDQTVAATIIDDKLMVFQHASTMNTWLDGQVGLGANAQANDLMARFGSQSTLLLTFDSTGVGQSASELGAMSGVLSSLPIPVPPDLRRIPWHAFQRAFGDVVVAVVPHKEGIRFILESSCGVFPAIAFMAAGVSGSMREERKLQKKLRTVVEALATAQEEFRRARGRYAISMWELKHAALLAPDVAVGVEEDFLYRVQGDGTKWHMEMRKADGAEVFRVDDRFQLVPVRPVGAATTENAGPAVGGE